MLSYVAINLFLSIIVICLNALFMYVGLMLNYHTLNLNFIYLPVALIVCFKANVLLRTLKYDLISCYLTAASVQTENIQLLQCLQ